MQHILIVEDERPIVEILSYHLQKEGYTVDAAFNGPDALTLFKAQRVDLVILDLMLPGLDGLEVCRQIRRHSSVPILILTAKSEEVDKVVGLEVGADDYVTKPFSIREIIARVRALLRRLHPDRSGEGKRLVAGDLVMDLKAYQLTKGSRLVDLTRREFEFLRFLFQRPFEVFDRPTLLQEIWGGELEVDVRTVDVTVRRVREKIENEPAKPVYLKTRRGIGYYFDPGPTA